MRRIASICLIATALIQVAVAQELRMPTENSTSGDNRPTIDLRVRQVNYNGRAPAPLRAGSATAMTTPTPTEAVQEEPVYSGPIPVYPRPAPVTATPVHATRPNPPTKMVMPNHLDWHQLHAEELACRNCQFPQHTPYQAENFSYYFRPYQYNEIPQQQAFRPGSEYNPYDNRFLQTIYSQVPATIPPPELIR